MTFLKNYCRVSLFRQRKSNGGDIIKGIQQRNGWYEIVIRKSVLPHITNLNGNFHGKRKILVKTRQIGVPTTQNNFFNISADTALLIFVCLPVDKQLIYLVSNRGNRIHEGKEKFHIFATFYETSFFLYFSSFLVSHGKTLLQTVGQSVAANRNRHAKLNDTATYNRQVCANAA